MRVKLHALVVGAGVGGLTAALALARGGHKVSLFERAAEFTEVGAGLQLSPNASGVLREFGLIERLVGLGALMPEALSIRRGRDGAQLARLPLGSVAAVRWGAPYMVAHRADLQRALLERLGDFPDVSITMDAPVAGFAASAEGVEIGATKGGNPVRISGDFLIGADGLRSMVRERLGLGAADRPIYAGRTAWRTLIAASDAPPAARRLETNLWLGANAHLVHYPLRGGELINVVAIANDSWRGSDAADLWAVGDETAAVQAHFRGWHKEARAILAAAKDWRRWPLFDRDPAAHWSFERVALLGDAAHPALPFLAQGAAQAIEDAAALARALDMYANDVPAALTAYEQSRKARATAVQFASRSQGTIYHLPAPLSFARDIGLRTLGPLRLMSRYDWLYRYNA